ncbi:hypothetical protein RhiirC2_846998 [Rhizophagus irregularis]|uniref:Acyl-CoA oxidase C-alpha1 domain-containing protein n=1 Tax=Rhizophagus irregularis TaxID=588596 RepID=A0A2N1NK35_9GLOM|nr:hypothetical protein RhiirC2_846998 [Rhizophagus irregularis]
MEKLKSSGKDYDLRPFIVQIRDLETQLRDIVETSVLNYTMQQYQLFPIIAQAYTTHRLTSGLTSLTTMMAVDSIEDCRKTCGGHDYSNFSGKNFITAIHEQPQPTEDERLRIRLLKEIRPNVVDTFTLYETMVDWDCKEPLNGITLNVNPNRIRNETLKKKINIKYKLIGNLA